MARPPSQQPTDGELELLAFLWEHGPTPLRQICSGLRHRRPVATTTVATMLGVMLGKGLVARTSGPRGYLWSAAVSRQAATNSLVGKLVDRMFDGSAQRLVAHLIESGEFSPAEQAEIESLLRAHADARTKRRGTRK
jgi:predicted transcriptional regulator